MKNYTTLSEIRKKLQRELPILAQRYNVKSLGVFGSYIHQQQNEASDLDLLVTFQETPSLLKYIELVYYLSDLVGIKVDLVMRDALKPRIGERILSEVVPV